MRKPTGVLACGIMLLVLPAHKVDAQTLASYGQQIAVAKMLRPDLAVLGVMSSKITDKAAESLTRAGMGQGVKIVIGRPQSAPDVPGLYKTLVQEKKIQMLLLPDADDGMMTEIGFEYLRELTLGDKVALIVPKEVLVGSGGAVCILTQGGSIKAIVNFKVATLLGLTLPAEGDLAVTYIGK